MPFSFSQLIHDLTSTWRIDSSCNFTIASSENMPGPRLQFPRNILYDILRHLFGLICICSMRN